MDLLFSLGGEKSPEREAGRERTFLLFAGLNQPRNVSIKALRFM
jgi:hypothetical protein